MNVERLKDLLCALQDSKRARRKYDRANWSYCPYGHYCKYMGLKPPTEGSMCYSEIEELFELTEEQGGYLFCSAEGPKNITEAIIRTEELISQAISEKKQEVSPTLRVKLKTKKSLSFNDLHKNDTFRYENELYVKISDTRAFNYHNSVLRECWEFGSGIEKTSVEIIEL